MTNQPAPIGHNNPPEEIDGGFVNMGFLMKFNPYGIFRQQSPTVEYRSSSHSVNDFITVWGDLDRLSASQIAHLFAHAKQQLDLLEENRKELSKFVELVKNVKLPAAFDKEKIKTFTLQDGTRVTKSDLTRASIIAEDQEEAFNWLRENGYPDAVKLTVNASTLGGIAGTILKNTKKDPVTGMLKAIDEDIPIDMPDDLFKVEIKPTTSVTKGKAKKK